MKVHHFARELLEHEHAALSLGYKRLRSVTPKLNDTTNAVTSATANGDFDIKSFIRADCETKSSFIDRKKNASQVEITPGGTRWNPTQEQIGILEMLYRGGLKTPNTQEIEQITAQLRKFGKIEGKNVFYWFQNHKARERQRQRQKHNSLSPSPSPRATTSTNTTIITSNTKGEEEKEEDSPYKRKCMTWTFKCLEENESFCNANGDRTLELFPLHPEGR